MVHLASDVTLKHKIVNAYSYSTTSNFSRKDTTPVVISNKRLVEEMSMNYLLFGGKLENDYLPVYLRFPGHYQERPAECSINVLLFGIEDKLMKIWPKDERRMSDPYVSVLVPDYIMSRMYRGRNEVVLESSPPAISRESLGL